ncbi:hypothetical protein DY000_02030977 [Brassica cretica]|uniref:Uncharacterized protein n=1 Tax=Brassica cretica TaxID=69181 RepID=A0ABQ7DPJ8_BRACR|nr:hypothetical protein DY000_02030977 [Brassica cretica]
MLLDLGVVDGGAIQQQSLFGDQGFRHASIRDVVLTWVIDLVVILKEEVFLKTQPRPAVKDKALQSASLVQKMVSTGGSGSEGEKDLKNDGGAWRC